MICGSGGSTSRLAKAAGAEPAGQRRDEKLHAVVARSRFQSQNVQNTPGSDHFWKLRCRKSAHRCGAKHISKSKCTKHTRFGPLLEVAMSKSARRCGAKHISKSKCTKHHVQTTFGSWDVEKLWREAHFQAKMLKTPGVRTTFGSSDVEKVHAVVARSTFRSQNAKHTRGLDHFWRFRCRFAWQAQGIVHLVKSEKKREGFEAFSITTTTTPHYTPIHYTTLHYTTLPSTTLHYTSLHYTTLHSTTLHYTLHYITLHSTTLHYTTLHYTTLHYTEWHCTTDRQVDRYTDR